MTDLPAEVREWILAGRHDIRLFSERGLGILLHDKQAEVAQKAAEAMEGGEDAVKYIELHWGNRAGKTTLLAVVHLWSIFYKVGLLTNSQEEWNKAEYRTLHAAPLNELAMKAWFAISEIAKGVSPSQRDQESGQFRRSPLAPFYACTTERLASGGDHAIVRCIVGGGVTDFRSTEGKGARLEGSAWHLITWDEWPQTENPDDIRYVLYNRLTQRASDYDAPIILTGTPTPETEHIAKEFAGFAEDPENVDWWGNAASRRENPSSNARAIERAMRNMDPEDIARAIEGQFGGAKGRVFPPAMWEPMWDRHLPSFQPASSDRDADGNPLYLYVHTWDLALADADNAGITWRVPADWKFDVDHPIVGVRIQMVPGSRTLTPEEIKQTIRETWLGYGGTPEHSVVLDTTDANGIGISRELRSAGLPIIAFDFHGRDTRGVINKSRAIRDAQALLTEGLTMQRDGAGNPLRDANDVVVVTPGTGSYGALRCPDAGAWKKLKDQGAVLRPDDDKQRKDAAMSFLMLCWLATRRRKARKADGAHGRLSIFAGGRA